MEYYNNYGYYQEHMRHLKDCSIHVCGMAFYFEGI